MPGLMPRASNRPIITWLTPPLEKINPGKINSRTVSSITFEERDWLVSLTATVPIVLFQSELAKLDLKGRT